MRECVKREAPPPGTRECGCAPHHGGGEGLSDSAANFVSRPYYHFYLSPQLALHKALWPTMRARPLRQEQGAESGGCGRGFGARIQGRNCGEK
eukprot:scaffold92717_cov31-Tisochrysis_lutea.AAC.3